MKIVYLDGYTLNPGDLNWDALAELGDLTIYERTPPELVIDRAAGAQVLLTNKVEFDDTRLAQLDSLQYIGVTATGFNIVDTLAARRRGIVVTNAPAYSTRSVSQMVFALLLEMTQQVGHHSRLVLEQQRWSSCSDFSFWDRPLLELDGLIMGLVGFGQIGRQVAAIARAFGMQVVAHTANPYKYSEYVQRGEVSFVSLDDLFGRSDVISLHCPLSDATRHLVDAQRLRQMKPSALLINTARGPLLDEAAVALALDQGRIGGLGADVLSSEPPAADHPLFKTRNVFITPHIAWASREARLRLLNIVVANLRAFLGGYPQNVVN